MTTLQSKVSDIVQNLGLKDDNVAVKGLGYRKEPLSKRRQRCTVKGLGYRTEPWTKRCQRFNQRSRISYETLD